MRLRMGGKGNRRGLAAGLAAGVLAAVTLAAQTSAPVADAAMQGDRAAVKALLQQGGDVNAAQGDGMTGLHWAAMKNDAELAQMLVYAGANVKATTRLGSNTPLVIAARNGNAPVVHVLLKAGADAKAATSTGTTPLMLAAASGNAEAVTALLAAGSDLEAKESSMQQTPLMFAAAFARVEVMKVLVAAGANVKATTKVVNVSVLTSPEDEFRPPPPPTAPATGTPAPEPNAGAARPAAAGGAPAAPATPAAGGGGGGRRGQAVGKAGVDRQFRYNELVGWQGGLTPLLFAVRQGSMAAVDVLLGAGADVNQVSAGDKSSPLVLAIANGHFDIALHLLDQGANPNLVADNGVAPLYGVVNVQWAPKALYPQPRSYLQQKATYLDTMKALLDKGADPDARLRFKVWYSGYNFDLSGVDEIGATAFWRAAYASDIDAMKLLLKYGADPNIPTTKPAGRPRVGDAGVREGGDVSALPPLPVGGPGVTALQAAAGVGYGEGFAANSHRYAPSGMMAAVKFLVEEVGADVNAADHEGNTALHQAAARGDVAMIDYLVSKGADVTRVNREGQSTADMANGPVQRTQPYPEALKLLEKLGAKNTTSACRAEARRAPGPDGSATRMRPGMTTSRSTLLGGAALVAALGLTVAAQPAPRSQPTPASGSRPAPSRSVQTSAPAGAVAPRAGGGARAGPVHGCQPDRAGRHLLHRVPQRSGQGGRPVAGPLERDAGARTAEVAEKIIRKLRAGMMPPAGAKRPDAAVLDALTTRPRGAHGRTRVDESQSGLAALPAPQSRRVHPRGQGTARDRGRHRRVPAARHAQRRLRQRGRRAGAVADRARGLLARGQPDQPPGGGRPRGHGQRRDLQGGAHDVADAACRGRAHGHARRHLGDAHLPGRRRVRDRRQPAQRAARRALRPEHAQRDGHRRRDRRRHRRRTRGRHSAQPAHERIGSQEQPRSEDGADFGEGRPSSGIGGVRAEVRSAHQRHPDSGREHARRREHELRRDPDAAPARHVGERPLRGDRACPTP